MTSESLPPPDLEHAAYTVRRGSRPLLVSIPHLGTGLPADLAPGYTDIAGQLADTDWHLDRLYSMALELGATVIGARTSRYLIDFNRPPDDASLYPGQAKTGLCPQLTFRGEPLYHPGAEPDDAEQARRVERYWQAYHGALQAELTAMKARHGRLVLWEAHSIASHLPRLFDGKLPDLNFGTNEDRSCDPTLLARVLEPTRKFPYTCAVNGRFKGGYITRHYGNPAGGIHAIQLEMCQSVYMDEEPPFAYRPDLAGQVQPLIRQMLTAALEAVE